MGARSIYSPILPLIEDEFMVRHAQASSVFVFLSIGYAISVFLAGLYSGRLGYKKTIALSLVITAVALFVTSFVKEFSAFYFFSFILGFAIGGYLPAAIPLITEYFAENNWNKSIAIHDSAAPIAIFCIPFIVLLILRFGTWRQAFEVYAAAFLISTVIFWWVSDEVKIASSKRIGLRVFFKMPSLWALNVVWILAVGGNMGFYLIVPLYLTKELSLSIEYANSILGASRLGGIGVAVLFALLIHRFNLRKIMFTMLLLSGIFTILTAVVPLRFISFSLFFQAIFVTGVFPLGLVILPRMFKEKTSMATGIILTTSVIFGSGLIPYLLGVSGDLLSFRFGISVLGILVCLSSLLILSLKELR